MSNCPVCQSERSRIFANLATPYGDRRERYNIHVCARCAHGFAIGRQDQSFLSAIYSDGFHETSQQDTLEVVSPVHSNALQRVQWLLLRGASGRLLDVGCGKGAFVDAAAGRFDASGLELSHGAVQASQLRGLNVRQGDFLDTEFSDAPFNVITFWDVLASFSDVRAVFQKAATLLGPSGLVVASVPMIDSLVARLFRSRWPLMIPPVNLHYFSHRSIALLAASSGFDVIETRTMAKRVALNFLLLKAARSARQFRMAEWLEKNSPSWPVSVNTHDIAYVIFRRAEIG